MSRIPLIEIEQVKRIPFNMIDKTFLLRVQWSFQLFGKQLRKSDDRMQRRSQLMTHVRQELALQPVGSFDLRVPRLQIRDWRRRVCALYFSCISRIRSSAVFLSLTSRTMADARNPSVLFHRAQTDLNRKPGAVLAPSVQIEITAHRTSDEHCPAYRARCLRGAVGASSGTKTSTV